MWLLLLVLQVYVDEESVVFRSGEMVTCLKVCTQTAPVTTIGVAAAILLLRIPNTNNGYINTPCIQLRVYDNENTNPDYSPQ